LSWPPPSSIFLREGIESSNDRRGHPPSCSPTRRPWQRCDRQDVLPLGRLAHVLMVRFVGVRCSLTRRTRRSRTQTIFETVTYVLGAVVLTYMTFWMRNHGPYAERVAPHPGERAGWWTRPLRLCVLLLPCGVCRDSPWRRWSFFTLAIAFASSAGADVLALGAAAGPWPIGGVGPSNPPGLRQKITWACSSPPSRRVAEIVGRPAARRCCR